MACAIAGAAEGGDVAASGRNQCRRSGEHRRKKGMQPAGPSRFIRLKALCLLVAGRSVKQGQPATDACRLTVQFGNEPGQTGNAIAEQRRVWTIFQMLDAVAPIGGRKGLSRRAGDYAFQMNEFAFENVVMHCLKPRKWPVWSTREV